MPARWIPWKFELSGLLARFQSVSIALFMALGDHNGVLAQVSKEGLTLQTTPQLQEVLTPAWRAERPQFITGDRISSQNDLLTEVDGHAELRHADTVIRADHFDYFAPTDEARAKGQIYLNRSGSVYRGDDLQLSVDAFEGFVTHPTFDLLRNKAHGEGSRADFLDQNNLILQNGTYSTCRRRMGPDWMPEWLLTADSLYIDEDNNVGTADHAQLTFYGVPLMSASSMSFPLNDTRRSGLLPPTLVTSTRDGLGWIQPYYLNLAPNRDLTLEPGYMIKRGLDIGSEFRYLETDYRGQLFYDLMPHDELEKRQRWGLSWQHNGFWDSGIDGIGKLGVNMNLNRVSDNNYWANTTHPNGTLIQRTLPDDFALSWQKGDFSAQFRSLSWQVQQEVTSVIIPPYNKNPELSGRYQKQNWAGFDVQLDLNQTHFVADPLLTKQVNATRDYAIAQVAKTWSIPGGFISPKFSWHSTTYNFDNPLPNGTTQAAWNVPTFSLDSGLVFEREARFFGQSYQQTLEPRAFFVNTPYRSQNGLPNYDSALNLFTFESAFSENEFVGNDRISSSHQLTLGAISRILDPNNGSQLAQVGLAERTLLSPQAVYLPGGSAEKAGVNNLFVGGSLNWSPNWSANANLAYNSASHKTTSYSAFGRYSPSNYRVINAGYLFDRNNAQQVDASWQWPLNDLWGDKGADQGAGAGLGPNRWYSVGRLNFDLINKALVNTLVGFEYDADCWLGRIVVERLNSSLISSNTQIMFQLELVGFSRLGPNPLQSLRSNVQRYQPLREQTLQPSRFGDYD